MTKAIRAALYLRVSTDAQTVENQRAELTAAATARGWQIVGEYADEGVSGSKGRDARPGLDRLLRDAVRGRCDVVMAWAVDRLGRSLPDLVGTMQELQAAGVGLYLAQQALDTTTPSGRAMFGMLGVFAEFERSMIQARVHAGLDRARAGGVKLGRKRVDPATEDAIRASLKSGCGIIATARAVGCGVSVVQRVKGQMQMENERQ